MMLYISWHSWINGLSSSEDLVEMGWVFKATDLHKHAEKHTNHYLSSFAGRIIKMFFDEEACKG